MPTPLLNYDFTGSAGVLPSPWTQMALAAQTLNLDGSGHGKSSGVSAGPDILAFDGVHTYDANQYALVTINGGLNATTEYAEVGVRIQLSGSGSGGNGLGKSGYWFYTDGKSGGGANSTELSILWNGAVTVLANFATTFAAGDVMKIDIVGNIITCYKNGVSIGTHDISGDTNKITTGGAAGAGTGPFGTNTVTIDNFEGGNTANAGVAPAEDDAYMPMAAPAAGPNLLLY